MSFDAALIFLAVEIIALLCLVLLALTRRERPLGWLPPVLVILAGIGLAVFLIFAFTAAV